jgi:hypothetical protein
MIKLRDKQKKKTRIITRFIEQDTNRGQFLEFKEHFSQLLDNSKDEIHFSRIHNWSLGGDKSVDYGSTSCGYLNGKFVVFRDGRVPLCCIDFDGVNLMGNVMDNHILEIFNSHSFNGARGVHQNGQRNTMDICKTCDLPETNKKGALSVKLTPSGQDISSDVFTAFDNDKIRDSI